jgi:DNA polymerase-3 subunit alpha
MTKYAGKETKSQYRDIDNQGLIKELCSKLKNESLGIVEQVKADLEFLEYTDYKNENMADYYYVVVDYKTYKEERKPYCTLRNIKTGEEVKTRVKEVKKYMAQPFGLFAIMKVNGFSYEYKKKLIDGEYKTTEELEPIMNEWEVIKNV